MQKLTLTALVLLWQSLFPANGLKAAYPAPCTVKAAATAIKDGLQAALRARHSRLSIELPPGTRLGVSTEPPGSWWAAAAPEAKVRAGDAALADFVAQLFPSDVSVGKVMVKDVQSLSGKKKKKKKVSGGAKGFGAQQQQSQLWCPALGLAQRTDVVLLIGRQDETACEAVDAASQTLGQDTAVVLLNSRRPGLSCTYAGSSDHHLSTSSSQDFVPAFALSPPPKPEDVSSLDDANVFDAKLWDSLLAYRVFPHPWLIAAPKTGFLASGADHLWQGNDDRPPDAAATLDAMRARKRGR